MDRHLSAHPQPHGDATPCPPPPGKYPDPAWLEIFPGFYPGGRVEHSGHGLHGLALPDFTIKLIYKFASLVTSAYKVAPVARDNFDWTCPRIDHLRQGVKEGCGI